jgi:hypothetical protein
MFTIDGLPAHPFVIHAIVVLLPLATLGAVVIAVRPSLRRSLGIPLALITLVGVAAVPLAVESGEQLRDALGGGGPLVEVHESRAEHLLPWAILFGVLVIATVVLGRIADRPGESANGGTPALRRTAAAVAVLSALAGIAVTALVVWIGEAGSQAVWQGVAR